MTKEKAMNEELEQYSSMMLFGFVFDVIVDDYWFDVNHYMLEQHDR